MGIFLLSCTIYSKKASQITKELTNYGQSFLRVLRSDTNTEEFHMDTNI